MFDLNRNKMINRVTKFKLSELKGECMRRINKWIILTILAVFFGSGSALCADVAKIGVVEFQRLFENSDAGQEIKAKITTQGKKMEAELKDKGAEIEELKKRLEREALVMSKEMREEKEREFRIKVNDIKTLQKKYEAELQGIQKKLMGGLQTEAIAIINEIGKSGGYLLIMDKRGVLYSPSTIDITDEVIKQFNAQYAKNKK
jgi:outer membrane protein